MRSLIIVGAALAVLLGVLSSVWAEGTPSSGRPDSGLAGTVLPEPTATPGPCTSDGGLTIEPCRMSLVITEPPNVCEGQKCTLGSGQPFTLAVMLVSVPVSGYVLAQSWVEFGTVLNYKATTEPADEVVWPDCDSAIFLRGEGATFTSHACLTSFFSPHPPSTYVGPFVEISLECSTFASSNDVSLLQEGQPPAGTSGAQYRENQDSQITPEVDGLTINCLDVPLGTATSTPTIDPSATDTPPPPAITHTPEPGATATPTDVGAPTSTPNATVMAMTPTPTPTSTSTEAPNSTPTVNRKGTPLPTSASTPASQQVGDASCNGTVDPLDAALILQFAAGLTPALPCPSQADASRDGVVDPLDAALILQFSAGLIDALPV